MRLPPLAPDVEQDDAPPIKERNVFIVLVNKDNQLLVEGEWLQIGQLREKAKEFLENPNDSTLPAGIGFHTAFNVPFTQTGADRAEGCAIGLSAGKRLELDARHLPKGHYLPDSDQELDLREGSCPAGGFPISAHYAAEPLRVVGRPFHGAVLTDTVSGVSLRYEVDEAYGFWMLWNKSGRDGFICPEPQTMAVNAPNLRLADRASGFRSLEPHSRWRLASKISCR